MAPELVIINSQNLNTTYKLSEQYNSIAQNGIQSVAGFAAFNDDRNYSGMPVVGLSDQGGAGHFIDSGFGGFIGFTNFDSGNRFYSRTDGNNGEFLFNRESVCIQRESDAKRRLVVGTNKKRSGMCSNNSTKLIPWISQSSKFNQTGKQLHSTNPLGFVSFLNLNK